MKSWNLVAGLALALGLFASGAANTPRERVELPYLEHFRALRAARAPVASDLQSVGESKELSALSRLDPVVTGFGAIADRFGFSLSRSGDTLLVGAIGDEVVRNVDPFGLITGSVQVYRAVGAGWSLEASLVPEVAFDDDRFGFSVAIAGDTAVVGAPFALDADGMELGAAWVFQRSGTTWSEVDKLVAADAVAGDRFGWSVATDGETVVVGGPSVAGGGAAYVFTRTGTRWLQRAKLQGAQPDAQLGHAVGVVGATVLAGAPRHAVGGAAPGSGAVLRYERSTAQWLPHGAFAGTLAGVDARFGHAIAFSGSRAVVGAPGDPVAAQPGRGSAYVFELTPAANFELGRLIASEGAASDSLGAAVALDAGGVLVGAPGADGGEGAGYVFVENGATFAQQARLSSADGGGAEFAGSAVAIAGDRAWLGAALDDLPPNRAQGSVHGYARSGAAWTAGPALETGGGASHEVFGYSVAIDGGLALAGAFLDDTLEGADDAGTATVFRRTEAGWVRDVVLKAPDGEAEDRFGISVAVRGDRAVVGAYWDIIGGKLNQGSAYVFRRDPGGWAFEAKLLAPDGASNDYFGFALAFDGETVLVGAPGHDPGVADAGAAYAFRRSGTIWTLHQKLAHPDSSATGSAGIAVALEGDLLAIGAPTARIGTGPAHGVVHVYSRGNQGWAREAAVAPSDAASGDFFGGSVALVGGQLLAGAPGRDRGPQEDAGSVYVFGSGTGNWPQVATILLPLPRALDLFGYSLAGVAGKLLAGAPGRDAGTLEDSGAAYLYRYVADAWEPVETQQAGAPQGFANFGNAVALDESGSMVGEPERDRDNPQEGAAYLQGGEAGLFADGFE